MSDDNDNLNLEFYEASDGPRVMLFGMPTCRIDRLADLIRRLSQGEGPFDLHRLPFINTYGGVRVTARSCANVYENPLFVGEGIRRIPSRSGDEFYWQHTLDGWSYQAELLSGLVHCREPCHQYLSDKATDDAIVVVSRGEYGAEVLKDLGTRDQYDVDEAWTRKTGDS